MKQNNWTPKGMYVHAQECLEGFLKPLASVIKLAMEYLVCYQEYTGNPTTYNHPPIQIAR